MVHVKTLFKGTYIKRVLKTINERTIRSKISSLIGGACSLEG